MPAWVFYRSRRPAFDAGSLLHRHRPVLALLAPVLTAVTIAGCTAQVPSGAGQIETSATISTLSLSNLAEFVTTAPSDPTGIYTLVARGIHSCWFGFGGPMSATHIFQAEAKPAAKGGQAEITIYERDVAQRDQRGAQAFRITFESAGGAVKVGASTIKVPAGYGEPMTRDVEAWAKGGAGCRLRAAFPQPDPTPVKKPTGKQTKGAR